MDKRLQRSVLQKPTKDWNIFRSLAENKISDRLYTSTVALVNKRLDLREG